MRWHTGLIAVSAIALATQVPAAHAQSAQPGGAQPGMAPSAAPNPMAPNNPSSGGAMAPSGNMAPSGMASPGMASPGMASPGMSGGMSPGMSGQNAIRPGNDVGTRESLPRTDKASNIGPGDIHSTIAPTPPLPGVGPDATVRQFLDAASRGLATHQTGMAQEALERAETRLLDRSVIATNTNYTDHNPLVQQIGQALSELGSHDTAGAQQAINQMLSSGAPALDE